MNKASFQVFLQLLRRDLLIFRREYPNRFFDTCFLFFTNLIVFGYFMTQTGLDTGYGAFILIGAISSFGLFDVVGKVSLLLSDIEGERKISYLLTLPATSGAIFGCIAVSWALNSTLLSLLLFPVGKLILLDRFDLSAISYFRLSLMYITINLFFGFFSLWLVGVLKGMSNLSTLFLRVINPIFMFGAYFYSWKEVFQLSPIIGYISFVNPMIYVMEGMRSAALGPKQYLPFWICFLAVWVFIFACGHHGIKRMKKKLDCV